ncbi:fibrinogen-like protein A [Apostichopus japonicus]|uniref:fibrinogen-like protein A n=1 Tax=Stichopus japonicus TaxID=307972 RepID=UPI003AB3AF6E
MVQLTKQTEPRRKKRREYPPFNLGRESSGRNKRSTGDSSYFFYQEPEYPRDCKEVYDQCEGSSTESGIYLIKPDGANEPFQVYCNNSIDGGAWTVFQRRVDGSVEFYRDWDDYRDGFGFLKREFWLGNDKISLLTNQKDYMLRIDLKNVNGDPYFAKYDLFRISDEETKYRLVGLGEYDSSSTTAIDRMANHRNQTFTTFNRDNDRHSSYNLAQYCYGAWWHGTYCYCDYNSNLNGLYTAGSTTSKSMYWCNLPGSSYNIKYAEMKIRPV